MRLKVQRMYFNVNVNSVALFNEEHSSRNYYQKV